MRSAHCLHSMLTGLLIFMLKFDFLFFFRSFSCLTLSDFLYITALMAFTPEQIAVCFELAASKECCCWELQKEHLPIGLAWFALVTGLLLASLTVYRLRWLLDYFLLRWRSEKAGDQLLLRCFCWTEWVYFQLSFVVKLPLSSLWLLLFDFCCLDNFCYFPFYSIFLVIISSILLILCVSCFSTSSSRLDLCCCLLRFLQGGWWFRCLFDWRLWLCFWVVLLLVP